MANSVTIVIDGENVKAISAINNVETKLDSMDKKAKKTSESSSGSFGLVDQALSKIGLNLGSLTAGFAVGSVIAGLGAMVKSSIDTADALAKMSQRTGLSVENLSTMSYALSLNDMSLEGFTTSVKKLSESMVGVSEDGEKTSNALVKIGVSATDQNGKLRGVDQVLYDVANKFATMPDGAQKAALAVDLFGKAGMDMIPFLNNGAEGIQQLQQEAKNLGLEVDTTTAKLAEQFNDQLETLERQAKSLGMSMASELLPGLVSVTAALIDFMKESEVAAIIGGVLGSVVKVLVHIFIYFAQGLSTVYQLLSGISGEIDNIINLRFDQLGSSVSSSFDKIKNSAISAQKTIDILWGDTSTNPPAITKDIPTITTHLTKLNTTAKKTVETFGELYAKMNQKYDVVPENIKKLRELGNEFEKLYDLAKSPDQQQLALLFYNNVKDSITGNKISTDITDDLYVVRNQLIEFAKTPIAPITFDNTPLKQYRDNTMLTYEEMANGAISTFGTMSDALLQYYELGGQRSKTMLALYKATAITQTAITTVQAAMAALEPPPVGLGPIFGIPLMGATIALGIANISRIASMQVGSGLAGGSSMSVPSIPTRNNNNSNNTTNNTRNQEVIINVYGSIVDQDKFAREMIPAIQKAYGDGV